MEIPTHFPFIELGNFTVMPNHVHGILIIDKKENNNENTNNCSDKSQGQLRFQNQGKQTVSSIVGSYKSIVSKKGHISNPEFDWQPRFHDHIIRNADSFERIQQYIATNPLNWEDDKFYS
jgi:REP element-mobilizing transposase RayT